MKGRLVTLLLFEPMGGGGCVYRILLNTQGVPQDAFVHWGSVLRRVRHEQFRGSAVAVVSTPAAR